MSEIEAINMHRAQNVTQTRMHAASAFANCVMQYVKFIDKHSTIQLQFIVIEIVDLFVQHAKVKCLLLRLFCAYFVQRTTNNAHTYAAVASFRMHFIYGRIKLRAINKELKSQLRCENCNQPEKFPWIKLDKFWKWCTRLYYVSILEFLGFLFYAVPWCGVWFWHMSFIILMNKFFISKTMTLQVNTSTSLHVSQNQEASACVRVSVSVFAFIFSCTCVMNFLLFTISSQA